MKQKLLLKTMLLLFALIAGSSSVWATDIVFTQVTAANQLNDGDEVLVVSTFNTKSIAMLSTVSTTSTKYMTVSEVTINTNTITLPDNSPITVWTIKKDGVNYSFKSGNYYIYSNSSSSNSANTKTTLDNSGKHTIEAVNDGLFQFTIVR